MTERGVTLDEDEEAFLARRREEELQRMADTSCMVRAVHEELADEYEERITAAAARATADTAVFAAIVARIEAATTP